uniref:Uncharacterized protein n=2 Tax=Clytia hemisphaerica TaxID=252671 RepID=A0A7M5XME1_9CNID
MASMRRTSSIDKTKTRVKHNRSSSQNSSVDDLLKVSSVSPQRNDKGSKTKSALEISGNTRKLKPRPSSRPNSSRTSKKTVPSEKKPAWLIKQSIEDETPRYNTSIRPSMQDFLDTSTTESQYNPPKDSLDDLNYQDRQLNADKSLLELLSEDTPRSEISTERSSKLDNTNETSRDDDLDHIFFKSNNRSNFSKMDAKDTSKPKVRNALLNSKHLTSKSTTKSKPRVDKARKSSITKESMVVKTFSTDDSYQNKSVGNSRSKDPYFIRSFSNSSKKNSQKHSSYTDLFDSKNKNKKSSKSLTSSNFYDIEHSNKRTYGDQESIGDDDLSMEDLTARSGQETSTYRLDEDEGFTRDTLDVEDECSIESSPGVENIADASDDIRQIKNTRGFDRKDSSEFDDDDGDFIPTKDIGSEKKLSDKGFTGGGTKKDKKDLFDQYSSVQDKSKNKQNSNSDGYTKEPRNKKSHIVVTTDYSHGDKTHAARLIQVWWRRTKIRKTAGAAAIKRMMEQKQELMKQRLSMEREVEYKKQVDQFEEVKKKEEKARQVRQQIIADMHKKSDNGGTSLQKKNKTNIKYALPNGKVSPQKNAERSRAKKKPSRGSVKPMEEPVVRKNEKEEKRPNTSSSVGRHIDEIFESSCKNTNSSAENTPRSNVLKEQEDEDGITLISESVTSQTKTTYSDLMKTLKDLEDDVTDDDENKYLPKKSSTFKESKSSEGMPSLGSTLLSADKLQSIMSFLDEVERTEDDVRSEVTRTSRSICSSTSQLTLVSQPPHDETSTTLLDDEKQSIYKPKKYDDLNIDSASQVASDITDAINTQRMEMDEKERTLGMMKKAMNQQKDFTTMQLKEMDKEHKKQLHIQRDDYEGTIKRHLSFIDQLIDDKKVLTKRCEELVSKLKDIDQKYTAKIKQITDSHTIEMKKQKEIMEAAEKIRREKWIKEKTHEIKEITVKGLEPDIQKLIAKHKAEIKKIKAMKQGEILEADERVGRKYIQQLDELRMQLEKEKEMAVRKERDIARQRFESQLREEEESFQQQRRRLLKEVEDEKERLAEQTQRMKSDFDEKKSAYEITLRQTLTHASTDHDKQLNHLRDKHLPWVA